MSEPQATTNESTNTGQPDTSPESSLLTAADLTAGTGGDQQQQQQGADTAAAEAKADEAKPVEYADFKLPDGMAKDSDEVKALVEEAKAFGLNQDAAQKFIDRELGRTQQQATQVTEAVKFWAKQSVEDAEFGGEKVKENLAIAERGIEAFGTPALRQLLKTTGLGNHPEIIRAFWKAGKTVMEDTPTGDGKAPGSGKSTPQQLYSKSNMNP